MAWKVLGASRGPRAHRAPLDLLGHKERLVRQELQERLVLREIRGQQDLTVWMVRRVSRALPASVPLGLPEFRGPQAQQVRRVLQEPLALPARRGWMVLKAIVVSPEQQELKVLRVRQVLRELWGQRASPALRAHQASTEALGQPGALDRLVRKEHREPLAQRAQLVPQDRPARKDLMVLKVSRGTVDRLALPEQREPQACRELQALRAPEPRAPPGQ